MAGSLAYRIKDLQAKLTSRENQLPYRAPTCNGCHQIGHMIEECPFSMSQFNYGFKHEHTYPMHNFDPYAEMYNQGWENQSNFYSNQRPHIGSNFFTHSQALNHESNNYMYNHFIHPNYNETLPTNSYVEFNDEERRLSTLEKGLEALIVANLQRNTIVTANTQALSRIEVQLSQLADIIERTEVESFSSQFDASSGDQIEHLSQECLAQESHADHMKSLGLENEVENYILIPIHTPQFQKNCSSDMSSQVIPQSNQLTMLEEHKEFGVVDNSIEPNQKSITCDQFDKNPKFNIIEDFIDDDDAIINEIQYEDGDFSQNFEKIFEDKLMVENEANDCVINKPTTCDDTPIGSTTFELTSSLESSTRELPKSEEKSFNWLVGHEFYFLDKYSNCNQQILNAFDNKEQSKISCHFGESVYYHLPFILTFFQRNLESICSITMARFLEIDFG